MTKVATGFRDMERTDKWSASLRLSILADLTSLLINNRKEDEKRATRLSAIEAPRP